MPQVASGSSPFEIFSYFWLDYCKSRAISFIEFFFFFFCSKNFYAIPKRKKRLTSVCRVFPSLTGVLNCLSMEEAPTVIIQGPTFCTIYKDGPPFLAEHAMKIPLFIA